MIKKTESKLPIVLSALMGKTVEWTSQAAGTRKAKRGVVVAAHWPGGFPNYSVSVWTNAHERELYERASKNRRGETKHSSQPLLVRVTHTFVPAEHPQQAGGWVPVNLPTYYSPRTSALKATVQEFAKTTPYSLQETQSSAKRVAVPDEHRGTPHDPEDHGGTPHDD